MTELQRTASAMAGPVTAPQAKAILILWASGEMDTLDIAHLLGLAEDAVWRTVGAARAVSGGRAVS